MAGKKVSLADYQSPNIYTWCTTCGNYGIITAIKRSLVELTIPPKNVVMAFDIGCNGNAADKIKGCYRIKGLHGRVIPLAVGIHLANKKLKVIASGGDGGMFNEGLNHLVHAVRSNYDITFILHNNSNFALTTGQATCITKQGVPMDFAPDGMVEDTINPTEFILGLNPSFVARGFSGNVKQLTMIIKQGLRHKGFSYIEVLQSCPTYSKSTTHKWYMDRVYDIKNIHWYDNTNIEHAKKVAADLEEKIATGVLYRNRYRKFFSNRLQNRRDIKTEIVEEIKEFDVAELLREFK